jgi:hypothetical protein
MHKNLFSSPKIGSLLASAFLMLAIGTLPAHGFCPSNGVRCAGGIFGITHEDITRQAVKTIDAEFFGKSDLTMGMKHALDVIVEADAKVDKDQKTASKHFDGESFLTGKGRILNLSDAIVRGLQNDQAEASRQVLGSLLHTLQDFYSHSNWIESGGVGAYSALWQPSIPISPLAGKLTDTCQACDSTGCSSNLITQLLTSGYFAGFLSSEDEKPQTPRKCRHGGLADFSSGPDGGINKDTLLPGFSPHFEFHSLAASSAVAATEDYLRYLRTRLTERQLEQLLGVGPTLAMAIDTTGSMGEEIDGVRDQAIQIVDARLGTDEEPSLYVLSPFNDPGIGPLTVTSDPEVFKAAINALSAAGGGDCPELAMSGMLAALNASDEGELFLWTDADAKDSSLLGNVLGLAGSKNIQIYPLLFGTCGSAATRKDKALTVDPAYTRLANETGGQLFLLSPGEAGQITRLADAVVRANAVDLLAVTDTLASASKTYMVPIDSTLTRVTFVLTGTTDLRLVRPGGTSVQPTDPDVQVTTVSSGTVITILHPVSGAWQVTAAGTASTSYSLAVKGEGTLSLDRFDFVEVGGGGHQGYFVIEGLPVVGDTITAAAALSGPFASVQLELHDRAGNLLSLLNLTPEAGGDPTQLFGPVSLPSQPFVVYARGTDTTGKTFQRVLVKSIAPQTLRVLAPIPADLPAGGVMTYTFEVKNSGPSGTFRVIASDDRGFVTSALPAQLDLAKNRKAKVSVQLTIPPGTLPGTSDTLTVSVESLTAPGVRNFAVVDSLVASPPAP